MFILRKFKKTKRVFTANKLQGTKKFKGLVKLEEHVIQNEYKDFIHVFQKQSCPFY